MTFKETIDDWHEYWELKQKAKAGDEDAEHAIILRQIEGKPRHYIGIDKNIESEVDKDCTMMTIIRK